MKRTNEYLSPESLILTVEVAEIMTTSPKEAGILIQDPTWNIDGDYGLD